MLGKTNQIFKKIVYTGIVASVFLACVADKAMSAPDSNSIVIDDIEFYVETDKSLYYLGENVQMLYRLTKLGFPSATILCHQDPPLNLVVLKDGKTVWMKVQGWWQVMVELPLFPNIPVEITSSWDMNDVNGVPVGPGTYDVFGVIYDTTGIPDVGVRITILPVPRTITVGLGAGYDFNTIQAAIDDAYDGDTIIVADGTYTGDGNRDIDFLGKAITLRSENGPENCIIDCNGTLAEKHRGFHFHSGEDHNSVVCGFTITNGYAERGGAIFCVSSSPTLTNCIFRDSTAKYWSQSIASTPLGDTKTMVNDGNGVHIMIPPPDPQWRGDGGGISCFSSSPLLKNCKFIGNWAYEEGGGMLNYRSSPTLINCTFTGNSASIGGGIANWIFCRPTLVNCTFTSNSSTNGNAVSCDSMNNNFPNVLEVINCILYDGGDEIRNNDNSTITVSYSNVEGGWPGTGNINFEPFFADATNGDFHLKSEAGRWNPNSKSWVQDAVTSPCIDAGNPGCPLGDEPAPNGNRRNMGAYGGTVKASKSPDNWRSIADLTNDRVVDSNDLKVFVGYWLETGECIPGDLNRNQSTNSADFALLANNWYRSSPGKSVFDFAVATKGPLHLAGNIEPEGVNISIESEVYIVSENSNLALYMIGNSHITGDVFIVNPFGTVDIQGGYPSIGAKLLRELMTMFSTVCFQSNSQCRILTISSIMSLRI
ncbi:MAG: hypothetical protein GWN67_06500 [Phycisphaerae bacterium]|nr:hypothetical protein [Phycisphaerae bacterium]NIP51610.1 hypothetical protein [Phycisphaerae bacterium]NIS50755.1 hypothetical protein [Phycisphaerae bacterium]NIU08506.1 hypothetical protein [Phycisphaerae bacterium]NIU56035.1 hypothetical protein [Phycisphaerae bacterium]